MAALFPRMISIMGKSKAYDALVFCLGILLIGCLIQAAGWMKNDRLVFPGVPEILKAFFSLLTQEQTYQKILVTLRHLVQVMVFSTLIGVPLGLMEGMNRFARGLMQPLMILLRSMPMIVLVVVVMVLARYERVPLIASTLFLIPLISEAAYEGCQRIEPEWIDVYRLNSGFTPRILFSVYLPLMAGYLKQAYISAVGMGLKLVVSTEYLVQTRNSLGKAINSSSYFNEYQDIYAYALLMILMVLLLSELPLKLLELAAKLREKKKSA